MSTNHFKNQIKNRLYTLSTGCVIKLATDYTVSACNTTMQANLIRMKQKAFFLVCEVKSSNFDYGKRIYRL